MALIGKIVTLFADKEKTLPRFPRTKISAVSDDNGVGLDVILSEIGDNIGDNLVYLSADDSDAEDTTSGATSLVDADTLGGYNASYFAAKSELGTQVTYSLSGTTLTITTK